MGMTAAAMSLDGRRVVVIGGTLGIACPCREARYRPKPQWPMSI
jgi:hypothetical protein